MKMLKRTELRRFRLSTLVGRTPSSAPDALVRLLRWPANPPGLGKAGGVRPTRLLTQALACDRAA
jgi:hypothetical protein